VIPGGRALFTGSPPRTRSGSTRSPPPSRPAPPSNSDPTFYESQFRLGIGDARATIRTLLVIAAADGTISSKERSLLDFFAARLGLAKADVDALLSELIGKVRARRRLRGESPG
jgi:hypothetical protein